MTVTLDNIKEMFMQEVKNIWGEKLANFIEMEYKIVPGQKAPMSIGGLTHQRAIDNMIVSCAKKHTLYIAPHTLKLPIERIERIIKHEVVHLGHPRHDKNFFGLCQRVGGELTVEQGNVFGLPPYQAQYKIGSRFKTIKRFNTEQEAYVFMRDYIKQKGGRGRIKV